jgi:hypothetical protein
MINAKKSCPMNEKTARKLFGEVRQPDGSLRETDDNWIVWPVRPDGESIQIDGGFTAEQLDALAWWIRNCPVPKCPQPTAYWFE